MHYSPPGSSVHEILQASILEQVAISFSGGLPDPGIETEPPELQADSLPSEPPTQSSIMLLENTYYPISMSMYLYASIYLHYLSSLFTQSVFFNMSTCLKVFVTPNQYSEHSPQRLLDLVRAGKH